MYSSWHPPVGVFIAILALLGVLVPLFIEKVGRREQALWTFVLFALVGLELRSIYLEREEHDREQARVRAEELGRFERIAAGIDNTIRNSQEQFDATMARTEKIINIERSTLDGVKRSLDEITGGDSFCFIAFHHYKGHLFISNIGKYTLYGVSVRVADLEKLDKLRKGGKDINIDDLNSVDTNIEVGDLPVSTTKEMPNPISYDGRKEANFNIFFSARNGFWTQLYRLRFTEGKWLAAIKVTRTIPSDKNKVLYETVEPGFPRNKNGEVDW